MSSRRDTLAPFGLADCVILKAEAERNDRFPRNWIVWLHCTVGEPHLFEAPEARRVAEALRRLQDPLAEAEAVMIEEAAAVAQAEMQATRRL